jgi:hypothetical protein
MNFNARNGKCENDQFVSLNIINRMDLVKRFRNVFWEVGTRFLNNITKFQVEEAKFYIEILMEKMTLFCQNRVYNSSSSPSFQSWGPCKIYI